MRKIAVVTVGRSDYGIYLPLLRHLSTSDELELAIIAGGMHLSAEFGFTERLIEKDGFRIDAHVATLVGSDTPLAISESMGQGASGFARAYERIGPDIVVVLGDRFEMHSAAVAAVPFRIVLAHIHGGELSFGAIDDVLRHSITKLSHLHFAATTEYARRIVQMGESPERVTVSGAPALDLIREQHVLDKQELAARFGIELSPAPLLVTYHPVTREFEQAESQVTALLDALANVGLPVVFTSPNADTNTRVIGERIRAFVNAHRSAWLVENFGPAAYHSMLCYAAAMVGNSSSGIIEAPSFELPVINIGTRQDGRTRAINVIDCGYRTEEIEAAIFRGISAEFRQRLHGMTNPYGDGYASQRILDVLSTVVLEDALLCKRFYDLPRTACRNE